MAHSSSRKVVYVAIAANVAIALCKYVAAFVTGSAAMLAEAFHSTADSCNELLLIVGIRRSERPPDELHPFGHGKELYFWSLIVAIVIFGLGGGLSLHDGITRLLHPVPNTDPIWNYVVLGFAGVFEGYSWMISRRELKERGRRYRQSIWRVIRASKDPTVFTVFLEDSAALIGMAIAFLGIFLSQRFNNPAWDAGASLLIGLVLVGVAFVLANESRELLLGERAHTAQVRKVRSIIQAEPSVIAVGDLFTLQFGPDQILLAASIQFDPNLRVRDLEATIERLERKIQREEPAIKRIFIEAESLRKKKRAA
jgi:cation diffusion facilitator family transporter